MWNSVCAGRESSTPAQYKTNKQKRTGRIDVGRSLVLRQRHRSGCPVKLSLVTSFAAFSIQILTKVRRGQLFPMQAACWCSLWSMFFFLCTAVESGAVSTALDGRLRGWSLFRFTYMRNVPFWSCGLRLAVCWLGPYSTSYLQLEDA